jgi:hypothetical protein
MRQMMIVAFVASFASVQAQSWRPSFVQYWPSGGGEETSWSVVWSGDTIYKHMPYPGTYGIQYMSELFVPPGCVELVLSDSGGNGLNGTFQWFWADTSELIVSVPQFGSSYHFVECHGTLCHTDLDGDGVVGVSDLALLLGAYGSTCN